MSYDSPTRRPLALGSLAGLVAAMAMILVQALLRLGLGVPSPAELIGDRLGERVPVEPFLNLIGRIGSYGRLRSACSAFSPSHCCSAPSSTPCTPGSPSAGQQTPGTLSAGSA